VSTLVGQRLGRYRIEEEMGSTGGSSVGGMTTVYRAVNEDTGETVALKMLPAHFTHNPEYIRRFRREYKMMSGLDHPNLVSIREYDSQDGQHFYTMTYVQHPTLEWVLKEAPGEKLAPARAARIGISLLEALAYIHDEGIIHRDLKPANAFVTPDDQIILADFGLAKGMRQTAITMQPTFLGTIVFASPEQIDTSRDLDHRADLYQAGLIVYLMVAGGLPYPRRDIETMIHEKCFKEGLASARTLNPAVPEALDGWLLKSTRTDAAERYQNAREMQAALKDLLASGALGEGA
jgi:eukaryotic-like serine/threonine-protein kinase